jgi:predicted nicotinamide N-methyase
MQSPLQTRVDHHRFDGVEFRIRCLVDGNQFDDPDGIAEALGIPPASWPFFGMLWPSGLLLADLVSREALGECRILELGCGLGIASLVANARGADILATDYHPQAEEFLKDNSHRNALCDTPFQRLDWRVPDHALGLFDLIIGSDLLYEPDHPEALSGFLALHSHIGTRIIIVDPKRHLHAKFRRRMEDRGFTSSSEAGTPAQWTGFGFKGVVQRFSGFSPAA